MTLRTVVTGASSGIGTAFADLLAKRGHHLILVARNKQKLQQQAEQLANDYKVEIEAYQCDLSDRSEVSKLGEYLKTQPIRTLINNAGHGLYGNYLETDGEVELNMIQVNIVALTQLTKAVLPQMVERKMGEVLNVASTAAFQPGPLMAVYYATKAYVLSFSEAIAKELEGTGVSVTALCPGATETGFKDAANAGQSKLFNRKLPSALDVAKEGLQAMSAGKRVYIHGIPNRIGAFAVRLIPRNWVLTLVKKAQSRI